MITVPARRIKQFGVEFYQAGLSAKDIERLVKFEVLGYSGNGTKSEEKIDCDPYEPGKSEIRRNYRAEHRYYTGGADYRVQFRLKQKKRTVASTSTTVRIQPGVRDGQ